MSALRAWAGILAVAVLGSVLTGCGGDGKRLRAFLQEPRSPVSAKEYRALPPDGINISSLHVPDINGQHQQIRPDGKINLPLIGEIYVADHTPKEIEELLNKASKEYYEQVDSTVTVDFRSQKIYVFGQVGRPGPVPYTGNDTLLDVLAQVQPTELAWPERIKVVRGRPPMRGGYVPESEKKKERERLEKEQRENAENFEKAENQPPWQPEKGPQEEKGQKADPGEKGPKDQKDQKKEPGQEKPAEKSEKPEKTPEEKANEFFPPEEGGGQAEWNAEAKAAVMTIDMMAMVKKGDLSHNVFLKPDDIIYVPPNPLAAIGLALQQILMPIRPAAETVSTPATAASYLTGTR